MKILPALLLLTAPGWLSAQGDPLKSPACASALAALDAARTVDARGPQLPALRDQAAQACLGGGATSGRSARVLQAPTAVPAPVITPPPQPAPLPLPRMPSPPVEIGRPPMPTHCDAGGCWANDGGHLRHVGPNLAGPAGTCVPQGGQLFCP